MEEKKMKQVLKHGNENEISAFFELVYNKYKGLVSFVVARYIIDEEICKDIVHDTFVQFFSKANSIESNIQSYLTTTAKNLSLNYLKKQKIYVELNEDTLFYQEKFEEGKYAFIVSKMKEILEEKEWKIILLHLIEEQTFKELSIRFKISESTIKTIYFRGLKKIRQKGNLHEKIG